MGREFDRVEIDGVVLIPHKNNCPKMTLVGDKRAIDELVRMAKKLARYQNAVSNFMRIMDGQTIDFHELDRAYEALYAVHRGLDTRH